MAVVFGSGEFRYEVIEGLGQTARSIGLFMKWRRWLSMARIRSIVSRAASIR